MHDYDWERLVRSEISIAQANGKLDQYVAQEINEYDYVHRGTAGYLISVGVVRRAGRMLFARGLCR